MIAKKIPNPKKSVGKAARVGGLADYITAPEQTNHLEKCIASEAANFDAQTHKGRVAEMVALAEESRSRDPVDHWVISWKEHERPTAEQAKAAVETFIKHCGLEGHQYIWGLHDDTENMHVHIQVNRVNPTTLKTVEINKGFDREASQQAIALIEHQQGWSKEGNARYRINEQGQPELTATGAKRKAERSHTREPSNRAKGKEIQTGEKSAQRHTIEEAAPIIKAAKSWQELHAGLAAIGMRYVREGSGAKIYVGDVGVKASSADRTASIGQLQKRLGIFQPHDQEQPNVYFTHTKKPHARQARSLSGNGMRRMSQCHLAQDGGNRKAPSLVPTDERAHRQQTERVRRATGRDTGRSEPLRQNQPGWKEYTAGRKAEQAARTQRNADLKARHDAERKALAFRQKAERTGTLGGDWKGKGDLLNAMRSVLAAQQAAAKLDLREQHKAERQAMQQQHRPYPTYEQFLRERGGQELAERWRYKDSPDKQPCIITGKAAQQSPPRDIRDFEHRINGREVSYRLRGAGGFGPEAFVDRGKSIAVLDHKSPVAVTAALQLAAQKFGGKITVTGNDEYKRLCVQLATQHGIQIVNPELQPLIAAEKQRIEQQRQAEREAAQAAERQRQADQEAKRQAEQREKERAGNLAELASATPAEREAAEKHMAKMLEGHQVAPSDRDELLGMSVRAVREEAAHEREMAQMQKELAIEKSRGMSRGR